MNLMFGRVNSYVMIIGSCNNGTGERLFKKVGN